MTLRIDRFEYTGDPKVVTAYFADNDVGTGTYDMQLAARSDFEFCVAPIFTVPGPGAASVSLPGLNPGSMYFARVRNRASNGTVTPWSDVAAFTTKPGSARNTAPAAVMIEPSIFVKPEVPVGFRTYVSAVSGFPIQNLFRDSPAAARFTYYDANRVNFLFEVQLGGSPIDTIAFLNTNIPEGAMVNVLAGDVPINSGGDIRFSANDIPARASLNLPQRPGFHSLLRLPSPQSFRFWRFEIYNCAVPGGLLHIEHMVMGLNRASKNHSVEKQESPTPLTTLDRKRSGIPDRVRGRPMRSVDFELNMLSEAQYETIYGDLWRHELEPVLVVPNSKSGAFLHDRILYGDLAGGRTVNPVSPRYNRSFTIRSLV